MKSNLTMMTHRLPAQVALLGLLAAVSISSPVRAQAIAQETPEQAQRMADSLFAGKYAIDDSNPTRSIPSAAQRDADPLAFATLLMELGERAERAEKRGDFDGAAGYYRALIVAVPNEAAGYARLCSAYERSNHRLEALTACADGLAKPGVTLEDFSHYVHLVLASRDPLSDRRIADLDALIAHLDQAAPGSLIPAQLRCDVGVRLLDVARLTACTRVLHARAPNDGKTLGYEWTLALRQGDRAAADKVVQRAKHSMLRPDAVLLMEQATGDLFSPWQRTLARLSAAAPWLLGCGAALGLLLLFVLRQRGLLRWPALVGAHPIQQGNLR